MAGRHPGPYRVRQHAYSHPPGRQRPAPGPNTARRYRQLGTDRHKPPTVRPASWNFPSTNLRAIRMPGDDSPAKVAGQTCCQGGHPRRGHPVSTWCPPAPCRLLIGVGAGHKVRAWTTWDRRIRALAAAQLSDRAIAREVGLSRTAVCKRRAKLADADDGQPGPVGRRRRRRSGPSGRHRGTRAGAAVHVRRIRAGQPGPGPR